MAKTELKNIVENDQRYTTIFLMTCLQKKFPGGSQTSKFELKYIYGGIDILRLDVQKVKCSTYFIRGCSALRVHSPRNSPLEQQFCRT